MLAERGYARLPVGQTRGALLARTLFDPLMGGQAGGVADEFATEIAPIQCSLISFEPETEGVRAAALFC